MLTVNICLVLTIFKCVKNLMKNDSLVFIACVYYASKEIYSNDSQVNIWCLNLDYIAFQSLIYKDSKLFSICEFYILIKQIFMLSCNFQKTLMFYRSSVFHIIGLIV